MPMECFYTLPVCIEEHRIIWRIESRLYDRVNELCQKIEHETKCNPEILEAKVAHYLFEELQQHPEQRLLQYHWMAFLARRCEKVALHLTHFSPSSFRDLVQMGAEVASRPVIFFEKFDAQRSRIEYWYPTLKRFSDTKIKHILISKLQNFTGLTTLGQTNLGLAARSSRTRVQEALNYSGYSTVEFSQYLLAWQCFQEVRNSIDLRLNKFKLEHFQEIANRYNKLRENSLLPQVEEQNVKVEAIKLWLETIGKAIRHFLDPPLDSLDTFLPFQLDGDVSLIDNDYEEERVHEEINQTVIEFQNFLSCLLKELKETQEKQILFLRYGLELKQAQIGRELRIQGQYQICRLLQRLNKHILREIFHWANLEPSSEGLNEIETVLCQYYSDQIDTFFARTIQFLRRQSREVLKLFYIVKLKPSEIGNKIHASETEVKDLLQAIRQWLYSSVTEQIQAEIQLQFQPQGAAEQIIPVLVETRLETILQLYLQ